MSKNIVILGNASTIFIYNYCKEVLCDGYNVIIISFGDGSIYKNRYQDLGIKILSRPLKKDLLSLKPDALRQYWCILKEFKNKEIDALHVHYVNIKELLLLVPLWNKARRRILTFWGSDLFEGTKSKLFSKYFIRTSTKCVLMIEQNKKKFFELFGVQYANKLEIIDFGNNNLTYIDRKLEEVNVANSERKREERFYVHIGYNATKNQNHKEIIKAISMLDKDIKRRVICILPMNYSKPNDYTDYKKELCDLLTDNEIDYYIEEKFLEGEDLAAFRCSADLFVLGHLTDARSQSPLEYVYAKVPFLCKTEVSCNYNEICKGHDDGYIVYDDYSEIADHVSNFIKGKYELNSDDMEERKKKIRHECSWDSYREEWRKLYE